MPTTPVFVWNPASRLMPLYDAEDARELPVNLEGASTSVGLVYPPGMVLGEVSATPGLYGPYNDAATDGTQVAKMINQYKASALGAAGAVGVLTWVGGEWGAAYNPGSLPAYYSGGFDISKIVGLDAAAMTDMKGHLVAGSLGVDEVNSIAQSGGTGTWDMTIPTQTIGNNVYPAVTIAGINGVVTAANFVIAVNAALVTAGFPAFITATGGALGTNPIVATFHGGLGGVSLVVTVDNTGMSGGTVAVTRSTHGVAPSGVVRFG